MLISFDPLNAEECGVIRKLLDEPQPQPQPLDELLGEPSITGAAAAEIPASAPTVVAEIPEVMAPAPTLDPKAGVEVDSKGTPWMAEVHAGNKSTNKDGTWRKKRGVDEDVVTKAEVDARAKIAGLPEPTLPEPTLPGLPEAAPAATIATATMQDVSNAYVAALSAGKVSNETMLDHYTAAGIDPAQLPVNETMRATFVTYLNGL